MAILSINTRLLDNTLEGARIIDMGATRVCECFVLPREKVTEVGRHYPALHQHGFYILLGKEISGRDMAYIGKTQDFTERVLDHKVKKEFWDTALVFVSKSNEIFDSEILYLEYLGYKAATEANNYVIENTHEVKKNKLSPDKQNEMELFFEDIKFLTRFYGCKVFDEPEEPIEEDVRFEFKLRKPQSGISATLHFYHLSQRYIIKAESKIAIESTSCSKSMKEFRKSVMENKKLSKREGNHYVLLKDIELTDITRSPSGAASFCTGTSVQGTEAWVDEMYGQQYRYPSAWWKDINVIL